MVKTVLNGDASGHRIASTQLLVDTSVPGILVRCQWSRSCFTVNASGKPSVQTQLSEVTSALERREDAIADDVLP